MFAMSGAKPSFIRGVIAALKCVRENSVVPPGLESLVPLFPALPRWAKLVRPCGAGFSGISSHPIA